MKFPFEQVIVVGGTGQIGHRLVENLITNQNIKRIIATSRAVLMESGKILPAGTLAPTVIDKVKNWNSLTDKIQWSALDLDLNPEVFEAQLQQFSNKIDFRLSTCLIIAAAFTNVEACETDPEKCYKNNEINPCFLMKWATEKWKAKCVFYSTDYVFDGSNGPYSEKDKRHAESHYGKSKELTEIWMEENMKNFMIIRTTGVFDFIRGSMNFVLQMHKMFKEDRLVRIPSDQYSNPVWAKEIALATVELLSHGYCGVIHVAGGEFYMRSEFAKNIAKIFQFDPALVCPVTTDTIGQKAKRPLMGGLKCDQLKEVLGWQPQSAVEVLKGDECKKFFMSY